MIIALGVWALGTWHHVVDLKLVKAGSIKVKARKLIDGSMHRVVAHTEAQTAPMIVIARHGRPALDRHIWINSEEYVAWWAAYDAGGLEVGQRVPNGLIEALKACKVVVSSTLLRARETAAQAAPERDVQLEERFVEAPLPPPYLPNFVKFRPRFWGVVARATWYFGHSRDQETRQQSEARAQSSADWLIAQTHQYGSVGLVAHGWFNRMLRTCLEAQGWTCVYDGHDSHWSHRIYRLKS